MKFTELPEEYRPENFQFPERVEVDFATFTQAVESSQYNSFDYDTGAPFMYIFADARHVEYIEAYTRRSLLPQEMVMVKVFKAIAKSKGPFVVGAQYGFTSPDASFPRRCQACRDDTHTQRVFAPFHIAYSERLSDYDFRTALTRRLAKELGVRRYSSSIRIHNTSVYQYQIQRWAVPIVFIGEHQHLYCSPEARNAENE